MKIAGISASRISTLGIMLLRAVDNEPIPRADVTMADVWNPEVTEEGEEMDVWDAHKHPEVAYITVSIANGDGEYRDIVDIDCLDAYSATEVQALFLDASHCRHIFELAASGKSEDGKDLEADYRQTLATEARQKALPWTRLAKPGGLVAGSNDPYEHERTPEIAKLHGTCHVAHPDSASWTLFSLYGKGGGGRTQSHIITLNPASARAVRELRDELAAVAEGAGQLRRHLASGMPTPFVVSAIHREHDLSPSAADVRDSDDLAAYVEAEGIVISEDADADEIFAAATAVSPDGMPFRGRRQALGLANHMIELRSSHGARP